MLIAPRAQDADLRVKRLERLEVTARQRGATPAQMEDWRMLRDRELDVEWMLNRDSVRSKARWVALQGSPLANHRPACSPARPSISRNPTCPAA